MATKITKARQNGEARADELLSKYNPQQAPVPIREIAISEGCLVNGLVLDDDLSGMAFVRNGQSVIIFNSAHHPNRQRFTIAHELAHHTMHKSMMLEGVHVDKGILRRDISSSMGVDDREVEANAFAATLLMPKSLIIRYANTSIDMENEQVVAQLAKIFGVSSAAFTNRLLNLSLN
ncbi:ImmA/IrrE family metallo-endopeptidase [Sphingopyxis sp.]|uniref:ImmA/IrrE family metallo-endopeptidase n=1 Tax=Sphingopyxis sp. TaxID=1908224 RepID=UPI002FC75BD6